MAKYGWRSEDMPDQTGRIAAVTGANSGIGFEIARALARKGAKVVMACRNMERATAAVGRIRGENLSGRVEVLQLDLADLASVRDFARAFRAAYDRLDLLINNAGVLEPSKRTETADGFELHFGTNYLGHFALTGFLLDLLLTTPGSRVVVMSSLLHRQGRIDLNDLQAREAYGFSKAYSQSKLANLLFAFELQRRLAAAGAETLAAAAHPGWTGTDILHLPRTVQRMNAVLGQSPEAGALPILYAATAPDVQGGDYYGPIGFMEIRGAPTRFAPAKSPATRLPRSGCGRYPKN